MHIATHSVATSVLLAFIFTDMEGLTELILGTATSIADQAFSREMEEDADQFAIHALIDKGESPIYLAQALSALRDAHFKVQKKTDQTTPKESDQEKSILQYLSTHPAIDDRITNAEEAAKKATR